MDDDRKMNLWQKGFLVVLGLWVVGGAASFAYQQGQEARHREDYNALLERVEAVESAYGPLLRQGGDHAVRIRAIEEQINSPLSASPPR